jgi:subtilisin-like proprotein convertase family protein
MPLVNDSCPSLRIASTCVLLMTLAACGGGGSGSTSTAGTGSGGGGIAVGSLNGLSNPGCLYSYSLTAAPTLTGNDPQLSSQWHLNNTGPSQSGGVAGEDVRAITAWSTTRGGGNTVAVVDDAIELLHTDLAPNIVAGSFDYRPASFGGQFPLPCTVQDDHGTAVAGIIAARDNNQTGGAGVAPRSSLMGFNALATNTDADISDALTRQASVVGVYNNSWGSPDTGRLSAAPTTFVNAITRGLSVGRGGRGAVYVFPAGNGGCGINEINCVSDNSNFDGYTNLNGVITACAVDSSGLRPNYGETGANVLVCGPSSSTRVLSTIGTTGVQSSFRSGPQGFTGTSASTPIVAGVASLVLSANPNLTWRDVRIILARSARKNNRTDGGWALPTFNLARTDLEYNPQYGFGVVDATAAVLQATTWTSVGGSSALKSCGPFAQSTSAPIPSVVFGSLGLYPAVINRNSPVPDLIQSVSVPSSCAVSQIEFIEVRVTITHDYSGDLRIALVSPAGLVSQLATDRACAFLDGGVQTPTSCGDYNDWRFGSVRHLDESAIGSWQLRVLDAVQDPDNGVLNSWSITFYGR